MKPKRRRARLAARIAAWELSPKMSKVGEGMPYYKPGSFKK